MTTDVPKLTSGVQFAQPLRRDSNNSTTSSSYHSMRSADFSRRSSQTSQLSSISTMRPSAAVPNYNTSSFYDPISPGSSRRSSQLSSVATGGQSLPPPPSSHLLSSHLQRLQGGGGGGSRHSFSGNANYGETTDSRRFSEPVLRNKPPTPPKGFHPNQAVVLDELEENEMVENKLDVIPEDMLRYLYENGTELPSANQPSVNQPPQENAQNQQQNYLSTAPCDQYAAMPPPPPMPQYAQTANNRAGRQNFQTNQQQQYNNYYSNNMAASTSNYSARQPPVNHQGYHCNSVAQQNWGHATTSQSGMQCNSIACHKLMGYFHRTDQSAHNCCLVRMMQNVLSLNERPRQQAQQQQFCCNNAVAAQQLSPEIQCTDISQSQLSPAQIPVPAQQQTAIVAKPPAPVAAPPPPPVENPSVPVPLENAATPAAATTPEMRQDTYQRTLEYVQNCQNWIEASSTGDIVTSSTHPSPNMKINDLSTSLNSYLEEDRWLQMIQ